MIKISLHSIFAFKIIAKIFHSMSYSYISCIVIKAFITGFCFQNITNMSVFYRTKRYAVDGGEEG